MKKNFYWKKSVKNKKKKLRKQFLKKKNVEKSLKKNPN